MESPLNVRLIIQNDQPYANARDLLIMTGMHKDHIPDAEDMLQWIHNTFWPKNPHIPNTYKHGDVMCSANSDPTSAIVWLSLPQAEYVLSAIRESDWIRPLQRYCAAYSERYKIQSRILAWMRERPEDMKSRTEVAQRFQTIPKFTMDDALENLVTTGDLESEFTQRGSRGAPARLYWLPQ